MGNGGQDPDDIRRARYHHDNGLLHLLEMDPNMIQASKLALNEIETHEDWVTIREVMKSLWKVENINEIQIDSKDWKQMIITLGANWQSPLTLKIENGGTMYKWLKFILDQQCELDEMWTKEENENGATYKIDGQKSITLDYNKGTLTITLESEEALLWMLDAVDYQTGYYVASLFAAGMLQRLSSVVNSMGKGLETNRGSSTQLHLPPPPPAPAHVPSSLYMWDPVKGEWKMISLDGNKLTIGDKNYTINGDLENQINGLSREAGIYRIPISVEGENISISGEIEKVSDDKWKIKSEDKDNYRACESVDDISYLYVAVNSGENTNLPRLGTLNLSASQPPSSKSSSASNIYVWDPLGGEWVKTSSLGLQASTPPSPLPSPSNTSSDVDLAALLNGGDDGTYLIKIDTSNMSASMLNPQEGKIDISNTGFAIEKGKEYLYLYVHKGDNLPDVASLSWTTTNEVVLDKQAKIMDWLPGISTSVTDVSELKGDFVYNMKWKADNSSYELVGQNGTINTFTLGQVVEGIDNRMVRVRTDSANYVGVVVSAALPLDGKKTRNIPLKGWEKGKNEMIIWKLNSAPQQVVLLKAIDDKDVIYGGASLSSGENVTINLAPVVGGDQFLEAFLDKNNLQFNIVVSQWKGKFKDAQYVGAAVFTEGIEKKNIHENSKTLSMKVVFWAVKSDGEVKLSITYQFYLKINTGENGYTIQIANTPNGFSNNKYMTTINGTKKQRFSVPVGQSAAASSSETVTTYSINIKYFKRGFIDMLSKDEVEIGDKERKLTITS